MTTPEPVSGVTLRCTCLCPESTHTGPGGHCTEPCCRDEPCTSLAEWNRERYAEPQQPRVTAGEDGVLIHLPEIHYLDTQVWAVDIGISTDALRQLRDAADAYLATIDGDHKEHPMTDRPAVDRAPIAHSVHYVVLGLPEVPNQYGAGVLAPYEITLTYRLGRVHAYVAGRLWVDGAEIPLLKGGLYGQHYDDGPRGWPEWLAEEARLHDPAVNAEAQQPETEAHPPRDRWYIEVLDGDEWMPYSSFATDRAAAVERLEALTARASRWTDGELVQRRLVRETTTLTVEPANQDPS